MKRPRRPAKNTARKTKPEDFVFSINEKRTYPRPVQPRKAAAPPQVPDWSGDQFYIDPSSIPPDRVYQWIVTHVMGNPTPSFMKDAIKGGWKRVAKREPVDGCVLMWAPKKIADAQRDAIIKKARDQMDAARGPFIWRSGVSFTVVSSKYNVVPLDAPAINIDVTIKFRLTRRLQDAAASLNLTPEVYAQRRAQLYVDGRIGGLILPIGGALELFEEGNFSLSVQEKN